MFAGGVAILAAVFSQLKIKQMRWSEGAMREGLLYDMIGRYTDEDARERTVRSMQLRYHVDLAQAARVEQTALKLLAQVQESWQLAGSARGARAGAGPAACTRSGSMWRTAATTATAPTCSRMRTCPASRARSSSCWRGWWAAHRRKLLLGRHRGTHAALGCSAALYLMLILRLAVLLHRDRSETPIAGDDARGARPARSSCISGCAHSAIIR